MAEAFARAIAHERDPRAVPWLYRTAFRLEQDELKKERRRRASESGRWARRTTPELVGLLEALQQSPNQRAAIVLRFEADLAVSEVASRMGITQPTVRVHIHRGRNRQLGTAGRRGGREIDAGALAGRTGQTRDAHAVPRPVGAGAANPPTRAAGCLPGVSGSWPVWSSSSWAQARSRGAHGLHTDHLRPRPAPRVGSWWISMSSARDPSLVPLAPSHRGRSIDPRGRPGRIAGHTPVGVAAGT